MRLDADVVALQEVESAVAVARVFDPEHYRVLISQRPTRSSDLCRGEAEQRVTPLRTAFAVRESRLRDLGLVWRERSALEDLGMEGLRWGTRIRIEPARTKSVFNWGRNPGRGLELVSLHLKAGCHYGALGGDERVKRLSRVQCEILRRQRGILERWIDAQALAGQPFVLAGDFNRQLDQPNDHFWRAIDDGAVCAWEPHAALGSRCKSGSSREHHLMRLRLAGAGREFPYPLNRRYPYAIDHIIAGGEAADWLRPRSYEVLDYGPGSPPSDHHPIKVRLDLPWPEE
jgi:endonuclease/exonuclease/phosphatase family metal-dependent hydrolase